MFKSPIIQMLGLEIVLTFSNLKIAYLEQLVWYKIVIKNVCVQWHGIRFDSAGLWSLDNDTARNVIILGVDNHHLMLKITIISFQ